MTISKILTPGGRAELAGRISQVTQTTPVPCRRLEGRLEERRTCHLVPSTRDARTPVKEPRTGNEGQLNLTSAA